MTDEILIKPGLLANHGWQFDVTVSGQHHRILCTQPYWHKISHGEISPMDVVRLGLELGLKHRALDNMPDQFALDHLELRIHNFEKQLRLAAQTEAAGSPR